MQSAAACACFVEVALFRKKNEKVRNLTKQGAKKGLVFGGESPQNAKNMHLGALGCKMEGPGPFWGAKWNRLNGSVWGAKWREREPFGAQNGGSGSVLRARWWVRRLRIG